MGLESLGGQMHQKPKKWGQSRPTPFFL